jgi:pyruvate/2-oxoglutarate dehydrogenase complex dihydrolipoamide acyltransferase (E2) component
LKKEGEAFTSMETLCEVTLSEENVTIAVDTKRSGVLATILVQAGGTIAVGEPVAMFVDDMKEYFEHVENTRLAVGEAEMMKDMTPDSHDPALLTNAQALLQSVRNMIKLGDIDDTTEFAKELQFLARKGNPDLLSIFEASCDNVLYDPKTFDKKFFLSNAEDIVQESLTIKKSLH